MSALGRALHLYCLVHEVAVGQSEFTNNSCSVEVLVLRCLLQTPAQHTVILTQVAFCFVLPSALMSHKSNSTRLSADITIKLLESTQRDLLHTAGRLQMGIL